MLLLEQTLWPLQGFCNVFIYLRPRVASVRKLHPDISYGLALYISLFEYDSIERARIIHKYSTQRIMASSRALSSQKCSVERYSSQKLSIGKRSNLSSEHHNPSLLSPSALCLLRCLFLLYCLHRHFVASFGTPNYSVTWRVLYTPANKFESNKGVFCS